jgi:hypothetical protein
MLPILSIISVSSFDLESFYLVILCLFLFLSSWLQSPLGWSGQLRPDACWRSQNSKVATTSYGTADKLRNLSETWGFLMDRMGFVTVVKAVFAQPWYIWCSSSTTASALHIGRTLSKQRGLLQITASHGATFLSHRAV